MGLIESIDFHTHTNLSKCADRELTLDRVFHEYEKRGYTSIGLTDHYYPERGVDPFLRARDEIEKADTSLQVFLSAEIELAGNLGTIECIHLDELIDVLDYISVAPHCKHVMPRIPIGKDKIEYCQEMLINAAKNPDVSLILHPWDAPRELIESLTELPEGYLREFATTAAETRTVVEISNCMTHYWVWRSDGLRESYYLLVDEILAANAGFVIGSDGHNIMPKMVNGFGMTPATSCDTSWAAKLVRERGGTDDRVRFPSKSR